jgi:hypothetical protein
MSQEEITAVASLLVTSYVISGENYRYGID